MVEKRHPASLLTMATSMCAVLYAIGAYSTAYIPSPWGFGQFRPAVIVPSFFATIFGPMPAAIGAAVGTLIADSVKHGYLYPGSFLAAVPGNFIGFYLFGYILKKKFSWGRFVFASNLTLTIGNLIVAFLYVFLFKVLYLSDPKYVTMTPEVLTYLSSGLTIWWFVTMLPFVLLVTPLLIRAAAAAFPSIVPEAVKAHSLREELPKTTFSLAMLVPGLIMIVVGLATTFTSLAIYTPLGAQIMFYGSGIALSVLGVLIHTGQRFLWQRTPAQKTKRDANMNRRFKVVAVGGTFDEFHKGHRALLMKAFEVGNRVLIGLCSDDFVKKLRKPHKVAPYDERLGELKSFLSGHGVLDRAEIMALHDPYGVTLSSGCVEAIVVSRETEPRANEINEKRGAKGLPPLRVVVIEMVPAENHVSISTTRIRRGKIDREGRLLKTRL